MSLILIHIGLVMLSMLRAIILCLLFSFTCFAEAYQFNSIQNLAEQEIGRIILLEIYGKLGIDIVIVSLPGKRAQLEVINGEADGEIMRIWTYGSETPTAIRVPTPYYYLETRAFVNKDSNIIIKDKDDLKKYRLAKVAGVKHTNNITAGMPYVQDLDSTRQLMMFLRAGRADVAITNTINGLLELRRLQITDIVPSGPSLEILDLFHYIHKDHKGLVPRIDAIIKEMIASGEMQDLIDKAEFQIIGKNLQIE